MSAPKLRFKDFNGDWFLKTLGDVSYKPQYGMNSAATEYDGENKYLRITDIKEDDNTFSFSKLTSPDGVLEHKYLLKNGDLLFARTGASVGKSYLYNQKDGKVYFAGFLIKFSLKESVIPYFIFTQTLSEKFNNWVITNSMRSGQPGINAEEYSKWQIAFTSKLEQTKIASFLSNVDEKISQLTQKHALLSQYKQGMMQKLFSQQIRFKADDGSEFGEWEEKTLIDSVDTNIKWSFTGGPFGSNLKSEDYTELGIRIIQLQNIGDGAFLNDYKIYTSHEKANELLSCNIYPGEILISKMGDPVARCCIVPKHHDRYVMCSDGIRLVVDKKNYSSIFMFYQINYQDFRQSASDVSTGSTRKRIGLSDLKQLPIKAPCLEEQTKIANFLSAIDQKIEVVAEQIEQAKTWKKGLLQQMFV